MAKKPPAQDGRERVLAPLPALASSHPVDASKVGPAYSDTDIANIAAAVDVAAEKVEAERHTLEAAAGWFRTDSRNDRTSPSEVRRKLKRLQRASDRVLDLLGDLDIESAFEREAMRRGVDIDLAAARQTLDDLALWATTAFPAITYTENGIERDLTPAGHAGDVALNAWMAALLPIYARVTGRAVKVKVSVGSMRKAGGRAYGPLVRFIQACAAPLSIKKTEQAILERVRSLRAGRGKSL